MVILGFDTATSWGTMALIDNDNTVFELSLNVNKGGGEYLLSSLDNLLQKSGRKINEIELIGVGIGPGSYTGIRVGLAATKGLAEGLKIPLYGISTLRIIAENARHSFKWIAAVIDGRRGEVYAALYESNPNGLREIESPMVTSAQGFATKLASLSQVIFCGNGSKIYQEIWSQYSNFIIAPPDWDRPLGSLAGRIAGAEYNPQVGVELLQLVPCYLRKVEAEVRLEEKFNAAQNRTNESRRP